MHISDLSEVDIVEVGDTTDEKVSYDVFSSRFPVIVLNIQKDANGNVKDIHQVRYRTIRPLKVNSMAWCEVDDTGKVINVYSEGSGSTLRFISISELATT